MSGPGAIGYAFCVQALNKSLQQSDVQFSMLSAGASEAGRGPGMVTWGPEGIGENKPIVRYGTKRRRSDCFCLRHGKL